MIWHSKFNFVRPLYFLNWQLICKDPWVLQAIEGYHIDFTSPPCQTRHPHGIAHTRAESNLRKNEVQDSLKKQAIHPRGKDKMGMSATDFLSPKKGVVRDQS